jgi:hypothetical protein
MDSFSHARLPTIFLLPSEDGYVRVDEKAAAIPMRIARLPSNRVNRSNITYLQYFQAISSTLSHEGYLPLIRATGALTGKDITLSQLKEIRIFSEKHGSDYHPARIEITLPGKKVSFVMNVAVTQRGQRRLRHEFKALRRLERKYGYPYLPRVFFQSGQHRAAAENEAPGAFPAMFLGEWFEGYHEFHIACDQKGERQRIVVWDRERGNPFLSREETAQIYQKTAEILTLYYDTETFEQIFPWHHAAGDFVVRTDNAFPKVRLITARQYAPMVDPGAGIPREEGLLFFFLNLSLRMRLDRVDGTGEIVWADAACLEATVKGFLHGLETQSEEGRMAPGMVEVFFDRCHSLGRKGLLERAGALIDACDGRAPDMPVVRDNLEKHVEAVVMILGDFHRVKTMKG